MSLAIETLSKLSNAVWRFFISLKLTFTLLVFIGIGAVIGMSFDQTLTFDEFYEKQPAHGLFGFLLSFFELYDAFHSWWFSLAVLLLALNLIACSIERLPRIYFDFIKPRPYLTHRRMLGLNLKEIIIVKSEHEAKEVVGTYFRCDPRDARLFELEGTFYRERDRFGRFGVYVVHIALLVIMFSSMYTTLTGVSGHVLIDEGKKARFINAKGPSGVSYIYDLGFYVGCEDFRLRTFVDNSPMEFESDLYINPVGNEKIANKTVRVNEPLSYAGFTFYQSSFRPIVSEPVVEIEVTGREGSSERYRTKLNAPIELPSKEILVVEKIYEDFGGLGQALRIAKKSRDGESTYFHIFRRHKDYDRVVRNDSFFVTFLGADQQYATGLSVGKVPGVSVIFFGFLLLTLGLYMCFFMMPVRYFARIVEGDGQFSVWLAALGFRNQAAVKEIFLQKIASIKQKYTR